MKIRSLVFALAAVVFLLLAFRAIFPRLVHFDIELTGTPGTEVLCTANCDGVVQSFALTIPGTVSFEARRDFTFNAVKAEPSATLSIRMRSKGSDGSAEAGPSFRGVAAAYHATIQGFSSRESIGPTK